MARQISNKRDDVARNRACALYLEGKSVKEVGAIMGKHHTLIYKWVLQAGKLRPNGDRLKAALTKGRQAGIQASYLWAAHQSEVAAAKRWEDHWKKHPIVAAETSRLLYAREKDRFKRKAKEQYHRLKNHPDWRRKRNEAHKKYMAKNPQLRRRYLDKMKANYPERFREWRRAARRKPQNKIVNNLRRQLRALIKGKIGIRSNELVGCSHSFLVRWLEKQFKRGMTWDNHGTKWHVDHIQPCAVFDLSNRDEQRKCFHYSNLRPLWAAENMAKSDKIIPTQPELCMAI